MNTTKQDIADLVTATVVDLGGNADDVRLDGDNIFICNKSVPISKIIANKKSVKGFLDLIKEALR